jgi:hypothetical protein
MKKPKTVIAAEAAASAKKAELEAAKEAVKLLEQEWLQALAAVKAAQTEADAGLPQCRLVQIGWRGSKEETVDRVVILRRTPKGMLVVRYVGQDGNERKFKWSSYRNAFVQAERGAYLSYTRELRDVPAEYLPSHSKPQFDQQEP